MILLLGASGYVGQAFATELRRRQWPFIPLTRQAFDYTNFDLLFDYVRKTQPEFIINAAGYMGKPNVDACEVAREQTLCANVLLPKVIARVCLMTNTPWGHVSSGYIYAGAKLVHDGRPSTETNLNQSELRRLFAEHPEKIRGFTEWDEPNYSSQSAPWSFYSGTKALAEKAIQAMGQSFIWRPGIPFNERDEPRNFLSKLQHCARVYDGVNSISHLGDFVRAALELWERNAPFGIYNVTNPGVLTTRQVVEMIQRILKPDHHFEFSGDGEGHWGAGAKAPWSNCILDVSKMLATGVRMRSAREAVEDALRKWRAATPALELRWN
ncbi:MAG: sugar nucleotide-binding protein [Verrucomicrobia bacterium]|nr:sugar nucleotide-binding protein [Verrucomicrobiota bacterium]